MLTKILVTALIIAACFAYLRYQQRQQVLPSEKDEAASQTHKKATASSQFQWLAGALLVLTACAAIGYFIYGWVDNKRVMTVKIINPQNGDSINYQVYKGELQERNFKTLQGQLVRISNNERVEITENP